MDGELMLGKRYFRGLSDAELFRWRPKAERGWFGWSDPADCANVSACNREMRRRAKVMGLDGPYAWLKRTASIYSTSLATTQIR